MTVCQSPAKNLTGDYRERLPDMLLETCVAELTHSLLCGRAKDRYEFAAAKLQVYSPQGFHLTVAGRILFRTTSMSGTHLDVRRLQKSSTPMSCSFISIYSTKKDWR